MESRDPTFSPSWHLTEHRGRAGFKSLEADWRRIYESLPLRTAFLSYEACLAYIDNFAEEPDLLRCLALNDGTSVRGICVLEAAEHTVLKKQQRVWKVIFHWRHACQANMLCADDEAHSALFSAVISHLRKHPEGRWLLRLGPSPQQSPLWRPLEQLSPLAYHLDENEVVSILNCSRPFEELRASISRKFRGTLNRRHRRLCELEDVSFTTVNSMEDGFEEAFRIFLEVEASGWKGEGGERIATLCDQRQLAYLNALCTGLRSPSDHCVVTLLKAEGVCIAAAFSTRTGEIFSGMKIGYNENYGKFSPGDLLAEQLVDRCCQDPEIAWLDMVSNATWARGWQPTVVQLQLCWISVAPRPLRPFIDGLLRLRLGPCRRLLHQLRKNKKAK